MSSPKSICARKRARSAEAYIMTNSNDDAHCDGVAFRSAAMDGNAVAMTEDDRDQAGWEGKRA